MTSNDHKLVSLVTRLPSPGSVRQCNLNSDHKDPFTDNGVQHLSKLTNLRRLGISEVLQVGPGLRALSSLTRLTTLNLTSCRIDEVGFSWVTTLTNLTTLGLKNCVKLKAPGFMYLSSLHSLTTLTLDTLLISHNQLHCLTVLTSLRDLSLWNLYHLDGTCLSALKGMTSLRTLRVYIHRLGNVQWGGLTHIQNLVLRRVVDEGVLGGLEVLGGLTDLCCNESPLSDQVVGRWMFPELRVLILKRCPNHTGVYLENFHLLEHLDLEGHPSPHLGQYISSLTNLQILGLNRTALTNEDLSHMGTLYRLKDLYLNHCPNISDLSTLSSLKALQTLQVRECKGIRDLTPLQGLGSLVELVASGLVWLKDEGVAALVEVRNLVYVDLNNTGISEEMKCILKKKFGNGDSTT